MGRYRQNFSLYPRRMRDGRCVWYYRTYSPDGRRTAGKSTGCVSKTKARLYCEELLKDDRLYTGDNLTFAAYAEGWFDEGSPWMEERRTVSMGKDALLSKSTLTAYRRALQMRILPHFGKKRLKNITSDDIREFRDGLIASGLSSSSVKQTQVPLKIILRQAVMERRLPADPFAGVMSVRVEMSTHDAFSVDEAVRIIGFLSGASRDMCIVAALTGMRKSELLGIRQRDIKERYLDLDHQLLNGEVMPLKTKVARKVPLCGELRDILLSHGKGYLLEGAARVPDLMGRICQSAGIADWRERHLSFHSWRHFFNTYMASRKVDQRVIAAVSGHSTGVSSVQSRYINFKPEDYADVYREQEAFLAMLAEKGIL